MQRFNPQSNHAFHLLPPVFSNLWKSSGLMGRWIHLPHRFGRPQHLYLGDAHLLICSAFNPTFNPKCTTPRTRL